MARPLDLTAPTYVPFVVVDACGDWTTFTGAGAVAS
jgi:hypothetical protein